MLYFTLAVSAVLAARIAWVWREQMRQRLQIADWFAMSGIRILSCTVSRSYGWPAYHVVFPSHTDSERFLDSPRFDELLALVARLNARAVGSGRTFDPRAAVRISPRETERATTGAA